MKKKTQFATNKLLNLCLLLGIVFGGFSAELFINNDFAECAVMAIVALLIIVIPAIFSPICYAFDHEGVSFYYVFLPTERYLWKNIRAIEVTDDNIHTNTNFFDLIFGTVFSINGKNEGKKRFYMQGHIRKSFRTKYLIEKYWDGTVTGYMFESIRKWIHKRKAKKQTQFKTYSTDEIIPMERELKAETGKWLNPFVAQAKQQNLTIKTKYVYITKAFEELNSRPRSGYTYTLISEIAQFNETNKNRIVTVSVDLLYVHLGRKSYHGVKNDHAKEDLEFTISDVLNHGIESFYED